MVASFIGQTRPKATEILRAHGLTPLRKALTPEMFGQAHPVQPPAKTILIPEAVFWLMAMAALGVKSMSGCVTSFWASLRAALPWLPAQPVQEEAFCTARGGLPVRFFVRVFLAVVTSFSAKFEAAGRWKGRRLLGLDGMEVDLPRHPHLRAIFPPSGNQYGPRGCPQARLVGLVGLRDGVCYSFRWTSLKVSEQASARRLARNLRAGDLLLGDRNFADKATFAAVLAQGADFLVRLPCNRFLGKTWKRLPTPSGRKDQWYIQVPLPPELQRQYPGLGDKLTLRILQYQLPGFRPSWLVTSLLDTPAFPYEELVELYHQRWCQETFHREWKHTLELSNLRSHTAAGLLKEVLVQLTLNNLIRYVMAEAAPPGVCPVKLKFLAAKRLVLNAFPAMTAAPVAFLPALYRQLLRDVARQRILVRPGRSYPRRWDARGRPKGHGKFAAAAKLPALKENTFAPI
jgi:hypothetical protein